MRAGGLLRPGRRVLVLLSGGQDSTCLLDLAARIAGPEAVAALHVNYGLRAGAQEDEQHCTRLCEQLGSALEVRRAGAPPAGNVQAWARELRYGLAGELAGEREIATGHTATDQVETILYRLASSPSRRALLGMSARAQVSQAASPVIRPLLAFTREQTAAYCRERGLRWREDDSNVSEAYARARVRARLVPALREIHPAAEANVLALAQGLRAEAEVLDELVAAALDGCEEIELARLRELPPALARLVLQELADRAAGRPAPGTARRAAEILALDRGSLDLPHGVRATVGDGRVRFGRTPHIN